jgi:site-specific DNA recombinase
VRYVIVKDIDRFSRDVLVYHALRAQFHALGIVLYSVNQPNIAEGTAEARLLEAMFSGISQYERDKILQRTLAGTKEVITKGGWITYAPYGYRLHRTADNVPTLAIVPEEAKGVRTAYELFAGGMKLFDVTRRLDELGFRTKRGSRLIFQTVYNMLKNPVYAGTIESRHFPGRLISGLHAPIIGAQLWGRVQARLSGKGPAQARSRCNPSFPLVGTLRCPLCAWTMSGSFSRSKTGRRYGYYHCRHNGCRSRNFPKSTAEENFMVLLTRVRPTEGWMDDYEQAVLGEWRRQGREQAEAGQRLDKRLAELEAKRSRIEDGYFEGTVDEAAYRRNLKRVEDEISAVTEAAKKPTVSEERLRGMLESSRRFFTRLSNSWEVGSPERKKRVQRLVFPEGVRCGADGLYRTLDLPPTLAIFRDTKDDRSNLVPLVRASWNSLLDYMEQVAQLMDVSPE